MWFSFEVWLHNCRCIICSFSLTCRDQAAPDTDANKRLRMEEGGRGHVYQTLDLDEMDYESMYTHTVPKKQ